MKISFIIPAYNEEQCIAKCLESIIKEVKNTGVSAEILVVDNASNDGTAQAALLFPNVKVVGENQKGVTFARQAGFIASTGDLVAFIDADSTIPAGWTETVLKKFYKKPKMAALSGPAIFEDLSITYNIFIRIFLYVGSLIPGSLAMGCNLIIRRTALQKIGGINTLFTFYGDDTDLARRLSKVGPVVFSFALPVYTSGRRIKKEGLITMGLRYQINYFWAVLFKKPFTKNYIDIRPAEKITVENKTNIKKLNRFLLGTKIMAAAAAFLFLFHSQSGATLVAKAAVLRNNRISSGIDYGMDKMIAYTKSGVKKIHFSRHDKVSYGKNYISHV